MYYFDDNENLISTFRKSPKVKKPTKCKDGYYRLALVNKDGPRMFLLHRLKCIAYKGSPPSPYHEAAHLDGNKENNNSSNIDWATPQQNSNMKKDHGTLLYGEKITNSVLTKDQVLQIREMWATGNFTQRELSKRFNTHFGNISCIILNKSWRTE